MTYRVDCQSLDQVRDLEQKWLAIESRCRPHFFLSWAWISVWLDQIKPDVKVCSVLLDDSLVAIALIVEKTRFFGVQKKIFLNQTGVEALDQMWIEYNDILVLDEYEHEVKRYLAGYLVSECPWDQFILGTTLTENAQLLSEAMQLPAHPLWESKTYGVALDQIRDTYLETLSRNSRYQIRKSFSLYEENEGGLKITPARDEREAIAYFKDAGVFHKARWGVAPGESGYANPTFVEFHIALIEKSWDMGQISVLRLHTDTRTLGYFYFFLHHEQVYFYLSGLIKEDNAKLKPGLCGHVLCVEYFRELGFKYYDFMGGDERYKKSLAKARDTLCKVAFRRDKLTFKIEENLRMLKGKMLDRFNEAGE